ncbi:TRAPP trafficking subunit Trs65-domain-containing protein [Schizophyllum commune]
MTLEQLFTGSVLDVAVPDSSIEFPPTGPPEEWLTRLKSPATDRDRAFFDEKLDAFVTVRVEHPTPDSPPDPEHPPAELLAFLSHVQIALEAAYINPIPVQPAPPPNPNYQDMVSPRGTSLMPPPRRASHHPSIFPPATPNPTPSAPDQDKRYLRAEGTVVFSTIWGQAEDDTFALLWAVEENVWLALYRVSLTVSYLRLSYPDPLLCLTASATLRDRAITAQARNPLSVYIKSKLAVTPASTAPVTPVTANGTQPAIPEADGVNGLKEANLLEGLMADPAFADASDLVLPSTRLGRQSRQSLFGLPQPPSSPSSALPSPLAAARASVPTLRKSYRRTLNAVSGFRVRMRTMFVPAMVLPGAEENTGDDGDDQLAAGNDERTVVLCIEVENSGEAGRGVGFAVEKVDVKISSASGSLDGQADATAALVGWGDDFFKPEGERSEMFPVKVGENEQWNLTYAVSFLRSPFDDDAPLAGADRRSSMGGLTRAVSINIHGKPYILSPDVDTTYPTKTFSSKWNCLLDLTVHPNRLPEPDVRTPAPNTPQPPRSRRNSAINTSVLPEPASPFPGASPGMLTNKRQSTPHIHNPSFSPPSVPGPKRHTMPSILGGRRPLSSLGFRASMLSSTPPPPVPPLPPGTPRHVHPSVAISAQIPLTPTTFDLPPSPMPGGSPLPGGSGGSYFAQAQKRASIMSNASSDTNPPDAGPPVPPTPAYPPFAPDGVPFPRTPTATTYSSAQAPTGLAPSVEIRRERGLPDSPRTPGPVVTGAFATPGTPILQQDTSDLGAVVVSVGLLRPAGNAKVPAIYPLDSFTLDIFIFNRGDVVRRFDVSCPFFDRTGRRKRREATDVGVLPLDNRVRVGPLLPSTCQSVRMDFMAVSAGVHCIDALTLTDAETGAKVNLRTVLDVVVHEPRV